MQAEQTSPDSRLAGTLTITYTLYELGLGDVLAGRAVGGGGLTAGTILVENDDGAWAGDFSGFRKPSKPWVHQMHALLEGSGGFEGLRASLVYDGSMGEAFGHGSQEIEGFIFDGPMPEALVE